MSKAIEGIDTILKDKTINDKLKMECLEVYIEARKEYVNKYGSSLHKECYYEAEQRKLDYAMSSVRLYMRDKV